MKTAKRKPTIAAPVKPQPTGPYESQVTRWLALKYGQAGDGDAAALQDLARIASFASDLLFEVAEKGNATAAEKHTGLLQMQLEQFNELCLERPALFEPLARRWHKWPGFITRHIDDAKVNERLAESLHLGQDSPLNCSGKTWTRETPETDVAVRLWGLLESRRKDWLTHEARAAKIESDRRAYNLRHGHPENYRPQPRPTPLSTYTPEQEARRRNLDEAYKLARTLSPITRQNFPDWFAAAKPLLAALYGNDFENRDCFADYWKPGQAAYARLSSARDRRAQIRRDIKAKLKKAFHSIAPK